MSLKEWVFESGGWTKHNIVISGCLLSRKVWWAVQIHSVLWGITRPVQVPPSILVFCDPPSPPPPLKVGLFSDFWSYDREKYFCIFKNILDFIFYVKIVIPPPPHEKKSPHRLSQQSPSKSWGPFKPHIWKTCTEVQPCPPSPPTTAAGKGGGCRLQNQ